jgi:hypothetical protein
VDHQREPRLIGEQADGDLRVQAAFLGESALAEPVPGIGLEIQGRDVVEDQARQAYGGSGIVFQDPAEQADQLLAFGS